MATRFVRLTDRSLFCGALVLALLAVLAIPGPVSYTHLTLPTICSV